MRGRVRWVRKKTLFLMNCTGRMCPDWMAKVPLVNLSKINTHAVQHIKLQSPRAPHLTSSSLFTARAELHLYEGESREECPIYLALNP